MMGRNLGAQVGAERTSGRTCLRVAKVYPWELGQNLATILPHIPRVTTQGLSYSNKALC